MSDLSGQTIGQGRYRIEAALGHGAQGQVYRGRHVALDMPVAIKVLPAASDKIAQKRFEREARRLARLRHPNIVVVHDYGHENGRFYIVEDFVEGQNLQKRLAATGGPLPPGQALAYAEQLGSALQYSHEQGTIHRDIKPSNILLSSSTQQAMLCDFGLARLVSTEDIVSYVQHQVVGTPAYMSPEQWKAQPLDARSDLYSFGLVVYEMLVGRHPFLTDLDTPESLFRKHTCEPPPVPSTLNRKLASALDAPLLKILAKAPAQRYACASDFVRDLRLAVAQPAAAEQPAARQPVPPAPPVAERPRAPVRSRPLAPSRPSPARRTAGYVLLVAIGLSAIGIARGWTRSSTHAPTTVRTTSVAPTPAPVCAQPGICLSWPRQNARVSGKLEVTGSALLADFQFFKIEIAQGEEPSAWSVINSTHDTPVQDGVLEVLNTSALPNGVYWIRLVVVDKTGNFPAPAMVRVQVSN